MRKNTLIKYIIHHTPLNARKYQEFRDHQRKRSSNKNEKNDLMLSLPDAIMDKMKHHHRGADEKNNYPAQKNKGYQ